MKKRILKNLKEFVIMILIYFSLTIVLNLVFKTTINKSTTIVFLITAVLSKLIFTIHDIKKNNS